jgi:hypothetical protein
VATDDRVERYAPLLRFSRHETYHAIDPGTFVARARLGRAGWSTAFPDACWDAKAARWDAIASQRLPCAPLSSADLNRACAAIQVEAPSRPGAGQNRRPNDAANLWRGQRAGYSLEMSDPFAVDLRGVAGAAPCLFFDRYRVNGASGVCDVIAYWFFYALHSDTVSHEGDWTQLTVIVPCDSAELPRVHFGRRGAGHTWGFDEIDLVDGTHPVAFVEPGRHGLSRDAEKLDAPGSHTLLLRTWRIRQQRPLAELPWACFDGSWGRAGSAEAATGPLGPLMRRLDVAAVAPQVAPQVADRAVALARGTQAAAG